LGFFTPKASYADAPQGGSQVRAFKEMVRTFHREGLEIILDVVFNHTAEGGEAGPTVSFRGLDNAVYYLMDPKTRRYMNFSGCGNTVNCNHSVVRDFVLDCLRYWVLEMHVDGFRFDLATILNRNHQGRLMPEGSLIDMIEQDPILADTKIIAEAWDMEGSQVGGFPGRWAEWNACYRDDVKRFLRGDRGAISALATRIAGSSDLFQTEGRCPYNSINYLTCHDGFTLYDLMSYNEKHNLENGEENRDGTDDNLSWNNGVEGPTQDEAIQALRFRKMRTAFTLLMVSQGVPMILAGDEFARTQKGNNNAYCQDNETSWVDWGLEQQHGDLVRFFRKMIALRKRHPVFQRMHFLRGVDTNGDDHPDLGWHGLEPNQPDWPSGAPVLAFTLDGTELDEDRPDDDFLILLNGEETDRTFSVPSLPDGRPWTRLVDTGNPAPEDIRDEDDPDLDRAVGKYTLLPGAAAVFISKRP
jgi:glycogen operon protein